MKTRTFLSLITLVLFVFSINVSYSQRNYRNQKIPKLTKQQVDKLRNKTLKDPRFRAMLRKDLNSSKKAVAMVLGPQISKHYRVYVGPTQRPTKQSSAATKGVNGKLREHSGYTYTITSEAGLGYFKIQLPDGILPPMTPTPPKGDAVNAFCLAESDQQLGKSWACTDEEVLILKNGTIRGNSKRKD